jgi:hypothetical protein
LPELQNAIPTNTPNENFPSTRTNTLTSLCSRLYPQKIKPSKKY